MIFQFFPFLKTLFRFFAANFLVVCFAVVWQKTRDLHEERTVSHPLSRFCAGLKFSRAYRQLGVFPRLPLWGDRWDTS